MIRWVGLCLFVLTSCSSVSKRGLFKTLREQEKAFQHHVGFVLYDVEKEKTISYKGDHYFTPGSNTKIITLFSSLNLLGDSLRALRYQYSGDSLIFWGTADPSFLFTKTHSNNIALSFLKEAAKTKKLYYSASNFNTTSLGKGWAWDDYGDYYYAERSPLPLYGNCVHFFVDNTGYEIMPKKFSVTQQQDQSNKHKVVREPNGADDRYTVYSSRSIQSAMFEIPFKTSAEKTARLLSDTLHEKVTVINRPIRGNTQILKSVPVDSAYKVMMKESDNFIAEHLLLQCADVLSDTLQPEIAIKYTQKNLLKDLPDRLVWVDGSGLSRYNLFTPGSVVEVWKKIYGMVPRERLFPLLATGGEEGTLKNYFINKPPYIFGKTGTLSNNHALSGYLVTKKGKIYIFAYMNSNYVKPTKEIRLAMESLLKTIYENH